MAKRMRPPRVIEEKKQPVRFVRVGWGVCYSLPVRLTVKVERKKKNVSTPHRKSSGRRC